jgi:hypothetical protein
MPDRPHKPQAETPHRDKLCKRCGSAFPWRTEWARDWDVIAHCSDACRGHSPGAHDAALEASILALLAERGAGKTICPSEAARAVATAHHADDAARHSARKLPQSEWQPLMEPARAAARRLVAAGSVVVTQHGRVVDAATAKGPIRLRLR